MTKRFFKFFLSLILSVPIVACSNFTERWKFAPSDNTIFENRFEQIIEVLKNKDRDGLKNLFSPYVLESPDVDINKGIDYIMNFMQGEVISYESFGDPGTRELTDVGEKEKLILGYYTVKTDANEYQIFFIDETVCTQDENKVWIIFAPNRFCG